MHRRLVTALGASLLLLAALLPTATAAQPVTKSGPHQFTKAGNYIVQLRELPAVAYDGSISGLAATKPAKGQKIDPNSAVVTKYVGHLDAKHDAEMKAVGATKKLYDYTYSFNGFSAHLTAAQANKLAADPDVISVSPSETRYSDTSSTPTFLGLTAPGGLWDQLGGFAARRRQHHHRRHRLRHLAGGAQLQRPGRRAGQSQRLAEREAGVPADPRLARQVHPGRGLERLDVQPEAHRRPVVRRGPGRRQQVNADKPWEFISARDYNGHGTHTSSTAGGNHGVTTTGPASIFGTISGMAPRARIAMYKALWSTQDASTAERLRPPDLVAAIDQAVADGVDVINYSISGTQTNFADPVEISYLFAADAGIFVAESAGNDGPTASTVAHPGPWTTTVAAGTHNRDGQGSVTLGNGTTYNGASIATKVGPAPLVNASAVGVAGANPANLALCFTAGDNGGTAVLDPAKVAGKIVVCERGVNARVNKSLAVQQAGGVGMILVNTSVNSINADFHFVPTVHLPVTNRVGGRDLRGDGGRDGHDQPVDDRVQRPGAVHGLVLVARPAPGGWR